MIEVSGLTKRFGETVALDGLELAVASGASRLAIIGPSGGGKSTLLRVLAGLEVPDAGEVRLLGQALPGADAPESELLGWRRRVGFLFQAHHLFPHLDVRENIALPLRVAHGQDRGVADGRAEELLERFGLGGLGDRAPSQLSGGQRQRVALARALGHRPEVLFLDEPTAALDPIRTAEVLEVIGELAEAGQRIVLTTHEMSVARAASDSLAYLESGKVVESGAVDEVVADPKSEGLRKFLSVG